MAFNFKCGLPIEGICNLNFVNNIPELHNFRDREEGESLSKSFLSMLFLTVEMLLTKNIFMFVQHEYTLQ